MVLAIEQVALDCGERLYDDSGARRFGGHSCWVSGARYLTGIGVDMQKVQLLARWSSLLSPVTTFVVWGVGMRATLLAWLVSGCPLQ
eukprot:4175589-Amphidinium_carterae.1